jgi:phosphoserine phosphatase
VPNGPGKSEAIREVISGAPDCAFGNSIWDREMLAMAKRAFAINPTPDLKEIAITNGWKVYEPLAGGEPGVPARLDGRDARPSTA